jgi:uncharacterized membrane protein YgcG
MEKRMITLSKGIKGIICSKRIILASILFFFAFFLVGCGTFELESNWLDREIIVDGQSDDWLGAMMYMEDQNISIGIFNDENFLYICMIAEDQFVRNQVMRQGVMLWFDPSGGKKETFGIRFPIGMQPGDVPMGRRGDEQDPERFRQARRRSMTELEILGPGKGEQERMPIEEAKGIEINVSPSSGMLVYELKVPLTHSEDHPYAIGAKAGSLIGIRLETPKMARQRMGGRGGMGGKGGMGGGRSGMGGKGGMGGGMRGGGMGPQMPKPLKVQAVVQLASNNNSNPAQFVYDEIRK